MIKFDLEKALAGDKVVTRDGREVAQLHVFNRTSECRVVCGILDEGLHEFWPAGKAVKITSPGDNNNDLFMAPKKLSGFVNVFSDRDSSSHKSLDRANQFSRRSGMNRIACIDLSQFEEGHGL
jgi:hypothetical protein